MVIDYIICHNFGELKCLIQKEKQKTQIRIKIK